MRFKVFTLLALLAMLLGLAACGEKATPTTSATATMASKPLPTKGISEKATPTTTATATEQRQIATPTEAAPPPPLSDLEKLLIDVFAPQLGEKVLVMNLNRVCLKLQNNLIRVLFLLH